MATLDQMEAADPHRPARARAARGDGPQPARPRRAQRRQRADAQPGRARRDEPDARRSPAGSPPGLELRLSQLLRLDEQGVVSIVRAGERRRGGGGGHTDRGPHAAAARPARRAQPPRPGAGRRDRRQGRPADARARQPRDRARRGRHRRPARRRRHATSCSEGDSVTFDADLPHHFENPGPGEAALLAVVSAGLRRS